ncbi:MAG: ribosomal protein S18 acetylase RimI-like enzyme [Paracoccaceae bacterium]|jgi:ribosomal protein S18 acetylase RimI-like enzyme
MKLLRLGVEDAPDVGRLLARAMMNDPLAAYMLPERSERKDLLPTHLGVLARYCAMFGEVYGLGAPLEGCAIWLPPGKTDVTPEKASAAGLGDLEKAIGAAAFARFFGVVEHTNYVHQKMAREDHWYLQVIGVDPEIQKSGLGQKLLQPILSRADKGGHPCYLETFAQGTIGYYEKLGFETAASETDPISGLSYWAMTRKPATTSATSTA